MLGSANAAAEMLDNTSARATLAAGITQDDLRIALINALYRIARLEDEMRAEQARTLHLRTIG